VESVKCVSIIDLGQLYSLYLYLIYVTNTILLDFIFSQGKLANKCHIVPITEIEQIHLFEEIVPDHEEFLENIAELEMDCLSLGSMNT